MQASKYRDIAKDIDEQEKVALAKLVEIFSNHMLVTLIKHKDAGKEGWACHDEDNREHLKERILEHLNKNDYVDAANMIAMLWMIDKKFPRGDEILILGTR